MLVLDTHVLLWLDSADSRLGPQFLERISGPRAGGTLCISTMTMWEVALLVRKRRLSLRSPIRAWRMEVFAAGLVEVPVSGEIAIIANELADFHPDPADRMIAATALHLGATLVTADEAILRWPGPLARLDARA